eukprot:342710-Pyramimonas_sp.AAC.1
MGRMRPWAAPEGGLGGTLDEGQHFSLMRMCATTEQLDWATADMHMESLLTAEPPKPKHVRKSPRSPPWTSRWNSSDPLWATFQSH